MKKRFSFNDKGQSLVLVTILAFVFLALLAIVLDGAYGYFQRRLAQNAADAGALAGADALCSSGIWFGEGGAKEVAETYATEENMADWALATSPASDSDWNVNFNSNRTVTVETSITFNTFFGRILGTDEITALADATAGCYAPGITEGVLPVAWSCRKPIVEAYPPPEDDPEHTWSSNDCKFIYGDDDFPYSGQIYIIMDGYKFPADLDESAACQDPPFDPDCTDFNVCSDVKNDYELDCDIDDDHINDIMTGGERSWLDLDGGSADATELTKWINGSEVPSIQIHIWIVGSSGNKANAYKCTNGALGNVCPESLVGKDVILPVFNHYCDMKLADSNTLEGTSCYQNWSIDEGQFDPHLGETTSGVYFHVATFAVFHITCVSDSPSQHCPVKDEAILKDFAENNTFSIEGYFVSGYTPNSNGGPNSNPWVGAYTVYLIDQISVMNLKNF